MLPSEAEAAYAPHAAEKDAALRARFAAAAPDVPYHGLTRSPVAEGWRTQLSFRATHRTATDPPRLHGVDPLLGAVPVPAALWVAPVPASRRTGKPGCAAFSTECSQRPTCGCAPPPSWPKVRSSPTMPR